MQAEWSYETFDQFARLTEPEMKRLKAKLVKLERDDVIMELIIEPLVVETIGFDDTLAACLEITGE